MTLFLLVPAVLLGMVAVGWFLEETEMGRNLSERLLRWIER